ncbi:hypothetical protein U1Q18_052255, partial [Sarracenia purpurea var. burkii]
WHPCNWPSGHSLLRYLENRTGGRSELHTATHRAFFSHQGRSEMQRKGEKTHRKLVQEYSA